MGLIPDRAARLRAAERDRAEAIERLAMLDAALRARRRVQDWAVVRKLVTARGGVYLRVLEADGRVADLGGETLPRRRFERDSRRASARS